MKIVLNRDIKNLGKVGEIVTVKNGYGRNFLLPRKYAVVATKTNVAKLQERLDELNKRNSEFIKQAEEIVKILDSTVYNVARQASDDDTIYGSIRSKDIYSFICELLRKNSISFSLDIGGIKIMEPIKTLGQYIIPVEIFGDVIGSVKLNVCRTSADFEDDVNTFNLKREKSLIASGAIKKESAAEIKVSKSVGDANVSCGKKVCGEKAEKLCDDKTKNNKGESKCDEAVDSGNCDNIKSEGKNKKNNKTVKSVSSEKVENDKKEEAKNKTVKKKAAASKAKK